MVDGSKYRVDGEGIGKDIPYVQKLLDMYGDLQGEVLKGLDLRGVHLFNADISGSIFVDCDLSGADFFNANLEEAEFTDSLVDDVWFCKADMRKALFHNVRGVNTDFSSSDLLLASFASCTFTSASFVFAQLTSGVCKDSKLVDVKAIKADFNGTSFFNVDAVDGDFTQTNLSHCRFEGVPFDSLNISGSHVSSVTGTSMYSVNSIGSYQGNAIYIPAFDLVYAGCWRGSLQEFLRKGLDMNTGAEKRKIKAAHAFFKACRKV